WSSTVKIYHQTRSEKIPSFYIPMKTETIAYIFTSGRVSKKVSESLKNSFKDFKPGMLSGISVSVEKSKSDIINVTANAKDPRIAAAMANAVADFGITEYLSQQNASVNAMISDMNFKKAERVAEVNRLREKQMEMYSKETHLPPPQELKNLKESLEKTGEVIYAQRIRTSELSTKITELTRLLNETPKEIEFETTMDNTTQVSLEGKLATLKNLRKRYTDENPKVKMLIDEIKDLQAKQKEEQKKPTPSKVTYRKNLNYADLELQLLNAKLEKKTIEKTIASNEREIDSLHARMTQINALMPEFDALQSKINVIEKQIESINLSLQNLEVLITSSIPDLNVLNRSGVPSSSTVSSPYIKAAALCVFLTAIYVLILVARKVLQFKILSDKEFKAMGLRDLGKIPAKTKENAEKLALARVKAYSLFHKDTDPQKIILLVKYSDSPSVDETINEFCHLDMIKGITNYRINCRHAVKNPNIPNDMACLTPLEPNIGLFEYYDKMHIKSPRYKDLENNIRNLQKNYDYIVLTIKSDENIFVISQLIKLAGHIVFIPKFNSTNKFEIINQMEASRELIDEEKDFCGLLTHVSKYYMD
ncbi:MAG: hypothetical protein IJI37_02645, partial [Opitutales bacterium]|nr:hypothetical protein [Opitutales bacterium]